MPPALATIPSSQLAEAQHAFRAVFEEALDAMLLADDDGRFVDANPAALRLFGRTRDELLQMSYEDLGGDREAVRRAWQELLACGTMSGDWTVELAGVPRRVLQFSARANIIPGTHLSILRDVTEDRRSRDELQRSRAILDAAFRTSPLGMAVVRTRDATILEVNDAAATLAGIPRQALIGARGERLGLFVDPAERVRMYQRLTEQGSVRDFPARISQPSGAIRDVLFTIEIVDIDGERCHVAVAQDVTAQHAAQRTIDETQDLGGMGTWEVELDSGRVTWSCGTGRILGRETAGAFTELVDVIHPDDRKRVTDTFDCAIAMGSGVELEHRIVRPDGETRWIRCRCGVETGADGRPRRLLGSIQDVTARHTADEDLRHSQALFAAAFRASPAAMAISGDGMLIDVNDAALELLHARREDIVGTSSVGLGLWVDPEDRTRLMQQLESRGSVRDFATRLRRRTGEARDAVLGVERIVVDGRPCNLVVASDVTEQRATRRMLEDTQRIGRIGGWSVDLQSGTIAWSAETLHLAGREAPPAGFAEFLEVVHPDDRARVEDEIERAVASGDGYDIEHRFVRPDGEVRWFHSSAAVELDRTGRAVRLLGTLQDITQSRALQEQLRSSQELLAEAFRGTPVGITIIDAAGTVLDINDAAVALSGLKREAIVGGNIDELTQWCNPADRERVFAELAARCEVRGFETRLFRLGEPRDVVLAIQRITVAERPCLLVAATDVTEHRTTQRLLEEAQSLGQVGNWLADPHANRLVFSREMNRILGIPETHEPSFSEWTDRVVPEHRQRVLSQCESCIDGEGLYECEYDIVRPDGQRRTVRGCTRLVTDETGEVVRMYGTVQDITEAHRAAAALAASEERYRRIVEASSQGIATFAWDGTITFANRRLGDLVGIPHEALVGRNGVEFLEADAATVEARRAHRRAGQTDTYDIPLRRADGTRLLVEITGTPLTDANGNVESSLALISDVTLRRQAEELRSRLAAIVESSNDAITSCSPDGTIETWNAAAERLFGYRAAAMIGKNHVILIPPGEENQYHAATARVRAGEVVSYEATRQRRDGGAIEVALTRSPVFDTSGNVVAVSTIARDITAQKQLESSLRDAEAQLRQAQKMEAISALAGGIAHDFNNILSVVLGCSTMIEESLDPADPLVEDARAIHEAADRAVTLTRQLLAFSRRQVLEPRVVQLESLVGGMDKMLRRLLGARITLVLGCGPTGHVRIDPSQFEQVILNLAINARDAMPDGGELSITCETVEISDAEAARRGTRAGPHVRVCVTDTGTGMDDATQARMFEPFFTTKEKGKGTGLGLATVFGIVRQSGGFVHVDTQLGRGTSISIDFPIVAGSEVRSATAVIPVVTDHAGESVLVVDDEEPVARIVAQMLRRQGYDVLVASNAGEAFLLAEQHPDIDLLVTDVVMPIVNGRQLAERIQKLYPQLPVLFMSGYHDDVALRDMLGNGGASYLQKPIQRDQLLRKIRELLEPR